MTVDLALASTSTSKTSGLGLGLGLGLDHVVLEHIPGAYIYRPTIFRALTYWAHRAVILAIA